MRALFLGAVAAASVNAVALRDISVAKQIPIAFGDGYRSALESSASVSRGADAPAPAPAAPVFGEAVLDATSPTGVTIKISSSQPTPSSSTLAWASFTDTLNQTGWSQLEIHGLRNSNDSMQSYAAGALEGALTWSRSYDFIINAVVEAGQTFPKDLSAWINTNTAYGRAQAAAKGKTDSFWYQTGLLFDQLSGLYDGFSSAAPKNKQLPFLPFYAATMVGDLFDLDVMFPDGIAEHSPLFRRLTRPGGGANSHSHQKLRPRGMTHCSASVSLEVPAGSTCAQANANPTDIFMAHTTWAGYETMSRIFKLYDLPVQATGAAGSALVPGTRVSFSSYPATLYSSDDIYATNAGLLVTETTLNNYNESLYALYSPPQSVLCWARVMVANRLATSGMTFSNYFLTENSGTYNNAWMVLDSNRFTPGQPLQDGTLTVVEQMPGYNATTDATSWLRQQCSYRSYNVVMDPFLAKISGQDELEKLYGPLYSYNGTSRALLFQAQLDNGAGQPAKQVNLTTMMTVQRSNNFETEAINIAGMGCKDGARNSANAISSRYDLNKPDSDSCDGGGIFGYGGVDTKISSLQTAFPSSSSSPADSALPFYAISGPTYEGQPVFAFHNSTVTGIPHRGYPDAWNFPWQQFSFPPAADANAE